MDNLNNGVATAVATEAVVTWHKHFLYELVIVKYLTNYEPVICEACLFNLLQFMSLISIIWANKIFFL